MMNKCGAFLGLSFPYLPDILDYLWLDRHCKQFMHKHIAYGVHYAT